MKTPACDSLLINAVRYDETLTLHQQQSLNYPLRTTCWTPISWLETETLTTFNHLMDECVNPYQTCYQTEGLSRSDPSVPPSTRLFNMFPLVGLIGELLWIESCQFWVKAVLSFLINKALIWNLGSSQTIISPSGDNRVSALVVTSPNIPKRKK